MKKVNREILLENKSMYNTLLKLWYVSFVPLFFSFIAFIFYFVQDTSYVFYFLTIALFIVFLIMFIVFNTSIMCEGGYTLINSMYFYKECAKKGYTLESSREEIFNLAKDKDYSLNLSDDEVEELYKIGESLIQKS